MKKKRRAYRKRNYRALYNEIAQYLKCMGIYQDFIAWKKSNKIKV